MDKASGYITCSRHDGCWEWGGSLTGAGYGQMAIGGDIPETTHRLSYKYFNGEIPEGAIVCHHCDNRKCFNPDHIYAGTYQSNVDDMWDRGRQEKGTTRRSAMRR